MWKVAAALLLVFSGLAAGRTVQTSYELRTRHLQELKRAIALLVTDVSCTRASLPVAFRRTSVLVQEPVALFLRECAGLMESAARDARSAWLTACERCLRSLCFGPREREALCQISAALGLASLEEQVKHLEYARRRVEQLEELALQDQHRARLWAYGGFAVGAVVCLVLV
ncbi:MAG: hypothetical protein ACPLPR_03815 [Bacillota bacterium]